MMISAILDSKLRLPVADVPPEVRRAFREDLTLPNPAFVAAVKQGRPAGSCARRQARGSRSSSTSATRRCPSWRRRRGRGGLRFTATS